MNLKKFGPQEVSSRGGIMSHKHSLYLERAQQDTLKMFLIRSKPKFEEKHWEL